MGRNRRGERHSGRAVALQLLYRWEICGPADIDDEIEAFWLLQSGSENQRVFATELAEGTSAHLDVIDPLIEASADHWRLSRMAILDRLIMRLAVYELLYKKTPELVILDEAIELAKAFSSDQSGAFVNGVLDDIRQKLDERRRLKVDC